MDKQEQRKFFRFKILQNRGYSLAERLIILGLFCNKANDYVAASKTEEIPKLITLYNQIIENGSIKESLIDIPANSSIQMLLIKDLIDVRISLGVSSIRYQECFNELMEGIQYSHDAPVKENAERYTKAYNQYFLSFIRDHEYILENYMVNYVYNNLFPLGGSTIFEEYRTLVMHFDD